MKTLDDVAVTYQMVLTKCDKVKQAEIESLVNMDKAEFSAMHPIVIPTSSTKKYGLSELRASLLENL